LAKRPRYDGGRTAAAVVDRRGCHRCGMLGHEAKNCPRKGGGRHGGRGNGRGGRGGRGGDEPRAERDARPLPERR
jgi:hypothetical protein